MARKPRIVVAGQPLHVLQRGNDRQAVVYADEADWVKYFVKQAFYSRRQFQ